MPQARRIGLSLIVIALVWLAAAPVAAIPRIILNVPDTALAPGTSSFLNIRLTNPFDTVAAFQFQLYLDRPDLIQFGPGAFDSVNTLSSGFELLAAQDSSGTGTLLLVTGIADLPLNHEFTPGIPPQFDSILIRLPVTATAAPDTTLGRTCRIEVIDPLTFVDPSAASIGVITDTVVDTTYWQCLAWQGDSCTKWTPVNGSTTPYDSVSYDSSLVGHLDTTVVVADDGSLFVGEGFSGLPCDFTNDGTYAITDITCFVSYLFGSYNEVSCPIIWCDCDASGNLPGQPNIADLTCLVAFLFRGGPPPLAP